MQSTSNKGSKGSIGVANVKNRVRLNLPRQWFGGKQEQRGLGLDWSDDNEALARRVAKRLELDFQEGKLSNSDGTFNEEHYQKVLTEYGIKASLRVVKSAEHIGMYDTPQKPAMSILEIWDMYCEYRKSDLAITTYELEYKRTYLNFIKSAIQAVGENAIDIRNWLLENRSNKRSKKILSCLDKAYQLAVKQKMLNNNPFLDLGENIDDKNRIKEIKQDECQEDGNLENSSLSFTWEEATEIMNFVENHPKYSHWFSFIKFKFLTGCRQGEAIAFWWSDVKWNDECIVFRRTYNSLVNKYKPTKNETVRKFPMPKEGELWNLLKSLPEGQANENVFKAARSNELIHSKNFSNAWSGRKDRETLGIIGELIEKGKIKKHLPPYNTRHTFITHQIYDLNRDRDVVNAWCEHSEIVSAKHYRDIKRIADNINPELPATQKSEVELLKEQMKQQQQTIDELRQLIEKLTQK